MPVVANYYNFGGVKMAPYPVNNITSPSQTLPLIINTSLESFSIKQTENNGD